MTEITADMIKMEKYAQVSTATSYSAAGGAVFFGSLTLSDIGIIVGIILGGLTFISNVVFRYLHYRLERQSIKGAENGS